MKLGIVLSLRRTRSHRQTIIIAPALPVISTHHIPVKFVRSELPSPPWSAAASPEDHSRCAGEQLAM